MSRTVGKDDLTGRPCLDFGERTRRVRLPADQIVEAHPTPPLPAAAERRSEPPTEDREQTRQSAAPRIDDERRPQVRDPDAARARRIGGISAARPSAAVSTS